MHPGARGGIVGGIGREIGGIGAPSLPCEPLREPRAWGHRPGGIGMRAPGPCHAVDEAKDLRDKAMALRLYAKQAGNVDAERKACEVRLRAERRAGELLKELARAPTAQGGNTGANQHVPAPADREPAQPSPYAAALAENSISTQQASRMQRLADVPAEVFEAALAEPEAMPTPSAVLAKHEAAKPSGAP